MPCEDKGQRSEARGQKTEGRGQSHAKAWLKGRLKMIKRKNKPRRTQRITKIDGFSNRVISSINTAGCVLEVHWHVGPGLLESFLRVLRGEKKHEKDFMNCGRLFHVCD